MKESQIGIYFENTDVPVYKSTGASGFDLRAHFNLNVAHLTIKELNDIIKDNKYDVIYDLYHKEYKGKEWVISFDTFKSSVIAGLKRAIDEKLDISFMVEHEIDMFNLMLPYTIAKFDTNIYTEIPEEDEMQVRPRSGISLSMMLDVRFGTVDNDWRGNTGIIVHNPSPYTYVIVPGMRLAQAVIAEKKQAVFDIKSSKEELTETERGDNGFGSTGV